MDFLFYSPSMSPMNTFEESHLLIFKSSWMRRYVENFRMHSVNHQISLRGIEKKKKKKCLEKCPRKKTCRIVISRNEASDVRAINHDSPVQSNPKI